MNSSKGGRRIRARLVTPMVALCLAAAAFSASPADARINYNDGAYAEVGGGCDNSLGQLHFLGHVVGAPGSYYQVWIYVWNRQAWTNTGWYESDTAFNGTFNYHGWLYMYAQVARPDGAGGWSLAGEPFPTTVQDRQYTTGSWCYFN